MVRQSLQSRAKYPQRELFLQHPDMKVASTMGIKIKKLC